MINSNDRLKHKYAYNINDTTKVKKVTMGSGKDFLSLNRQSPIPNPPYIFLLINIFIIKIYKYKMINVQN